MKKETIERIKNNPNIYRYLIDHSQEYKELIREESYINQLEKKSNKEYKESLESKIVKLKQKINMIKTIIDVIE